MSKFEEVRRVKKNLPYTVADVGGPAELKVFREEQKLKAVQWEMTKASRRQAAIDAFNRGYSTNEGKVSKVTKDYQRLIQDQEKFRVYSEEKLPRRPTPKLPLITRVIDKLVHWFCSIKF